MTSRKHAFPIILCRAAFATALLAVFAVDASAQTNRAQLAAGVDTEEPAQASPPQIRPSEEQMPQQSEQPKERKRTYDGPPRDELLPNERRLPA